jgi:N-acetylmuramoyl-L-alanine amidase
MLKRFLAVCTLAIICGFSLTLTACSSDISDDAIPVTHIHQPMIDPSAPAADEIAPAYPAPTVPLAPTPRPAPRLSNAIPASWIPPVAPRNWQWIIIHHSDSDYGSAAIIDQWHRQRGFDELGYHFVIGNGTNSGDGQIEVGPRWTKQKWGAHDNALDNRYNLEGIGICLVGNFNKTHPTAAQQKSLMKLVVYLMKTYHVPPDRILGHGETKDTECPGKYLRVAAIRSAAEQMMAEGNGFNGEMLALDR